MTQQLTRNIEGDFMMWKELLLSENVVREVLFCFLFVMCYPSSRLFLPVSSFFLCIEWHTCIIRKNSIASHTKRYHCALVFVSIVQGRLFSYHDTHLHRLGTNYLQLPVNCPYKTRVCNNQRDGPQTFDNQSKLSQAFDCDSFWTRNYLQLDYLERAPVAQLAEQWPITREVVSSTPAGPTLRVPVLMSVFRCKRAHSNWCKLL